jgi:urease accessory protein
VTAAHGDGVLELGFRRDSRGHSRLCERRQRFPLRMTVPLYIDPADRGMAFVYAQNPTGGVFAGDRLRTSVTAADRTRVHLTTQSATKLYRCEAGEAVQELEFRVGPEAYVEHVPDPLIPHAGSRFSQRLLADVAPGGAFLAAETLAPGRVAHGESLAYELLELHTEVRRGERELCVDRLVLEPRRRDPRRPGVLGQAGYLVSLMAVAPEDDATRLAALLDGVVAERAGVVGAAGELPAGAGTLARVLAPDALTARHTLRELWRTARDALVGLPLPPERK